MTNYRILRSRYKISVDKDAKTVTLTTYGHELLGIVKLEMPLIEGDTHITDAEEYCLVAGAEALLGEAHRIVNRKQSGEIK